MISSPSTTTSQPPEITYDLTTKEAASLINNGMTAQALETAARRGRIPKVGAAKIGGRWFFNTEWIRKFAKGEVGYVNLRR
jgi:hypothetical protein